jgi:hypothetical protein
VEREFTAATKTVQVALKGQGRGAQPDETVVASLAAVGKHQDAVIASLEQLLGQLAQWDNYRRFHREIGQLFRDEEEVTRRTSEVGRRTLTRELRDLSPQEAADLKVVAGRQLELARLLDRALQEMDKAGGELRQNDRLAAKTVADALEEARRSALSGQMRTAGGQIQQNQIGQAAAAQKQIVENLQEVLDILANRRQQEVARLDDTVNRLRRRQEDALEETRRLDGLERPQGGLTRALALAVRDLARLQRKLADDAAQFGRRLTGALGIALAHAGSDMGQAGDLLDARQIGPATQAAQRSAIRRLDLLLEAIKPEEPIAPSEIAQSDGPNSGQAGQQAAAGSGGPTLAELKLLKLWQQEVNLRTAGLQRAVGPSGEPTDEQARQYQQVSEEQGRLADTVLRPLHAEEEADEPLLEIGRQMREAQQRINQHDSGPVTQELQGQTVANLERLIQQARSAAKSSSPGANQPQPVAQRTPDGSSPSKSGPSAAQKPGSSPTVAGSPRPSGDGKVHKPDLDAMRAAVRRHWGELPEHARQQMRQSPAEEFPPKYEVLIEEYFRRLAEEKRRD